MASRPVPALPTFRAHRTAGPQDHFEILSGACEACHPDRIVAVYLTNYSSVRLAFGGIRVDRAAEIAPQSPFPPSPIRIEGGPWASLDLIEWKTEKDRALHLCTEPGFPLARLAPGVVAARLFARGLSPVGRSSRN